MAERDNKKTRISKCPEIGCKNPATQQCEYCKQYFCKDHARPKLVGTLNYIENVIRANEPDKYDKYIEDYRRKDGHADGAYSTYWNKEYDSTHRESLQKKFLENLDKLRAPSVEEEEDEITRRAQEREVQRRGSQGRRVSYHASEIFKNKMDYRSFLMKYFFYERGIIRSIIIAAILTILLSFNIGLIKNYYSAPLIFGTYGYVVDFFVVFFLSLIINWRDKWADLISAFSISSFLGLVLIPVVNSTPSFLGVFAAFLGILYLSSLAGNVIRHRYYNSTELYLSYALRGIFGVLLIVMIASAVTNQNTLNSFSNALSNLSSELNIGTSSSGAFSPGISGFAPLQVNSASCSTTSLTLNVYNSAPYEVCFYSITIVDAKRFYNGSSYPLVTGITFNFRYPLSNCIGGGAYGTIIEDSSTVSPSGQFIAFTCNSDSNYSLSLNLQYEYGLNGAVQEGYASGVIDLTTPPVTP